MIKANIVIDSKIWEKKLKKPVLSSNQTLIWNTLEEIGKNTDIKGFGKLFLKN